MEGHIQLIIGPMFAGKTTELLSRIEKYKIANKKCIVFKHTLDNRYTKDFVTSHDNKRIHATTTRKLNNCVIEASNADVIGIDEGQFFEDISTFADIMANNGKIVIIAALNGTFERQCFPNIINIIPYAEKITKLSAICTVCFKDAFFTKRIINDPKLYLIDSFDSYIAVCRSCYFQNPVNTEM